MEIKEKKISFVVTGLSLGGGERVVLDIARFLSEDGIDVEIVSFFKRGVFIKQVSRDINLVFLSGDRMITKLPKLISYINQRCPDTIFTISEHAHILVAFASLFVKKQPRIIFRFGIMYSKVFKRYTKWRDRFIPILLRLSVKRADILIAVSSAVAEDMSNLFKIPLKRIRVIYSLKDADDICTRAKEKLEHPWFRKEAPLIVASGRLHPQKDFGTLIDAFCRLTKDLDARLLILGEGSEREYLDGKIKKLMLGDKVKLAGFVENPYPYMKHADVFVLSSRWEGMPNVLLEAVILGLPVVSTDSPGGSRELLVPDQSIETVGGIQCGKYGVLVPIENSELLADALLLVLTDKKIAATYRERSVECAKRFSSGHLSDVYRFLFETERNREIKC